MSFTKGDLKNKRFKQLVKGSALSLAELKDIAALVVDTDPYIYPAMFDLKDALQIIPKLIEADADAMFRKQNLFVAYEDDAIIGLILWHKGPLLWNSSPLKSSANKLGISLPETIEKAEKEYFNSYSDVDPDLVSIINVCVDESSRDMGIATAMLSAFIEEHVDEKLELFTLKNNTPALKLYEKAGFKTLRELPGFSVTDPRPLCLQMKRTP